VFIFAYDLKPESLVELPIGIDSDNIQAHCLVVPALS